MKRSHARLSPPIVWEAHPDPRMAALNLLVPVKPQPLMNRTERRAAIRRLTSRGVGGRPQRARPLPEV